MNTKTIEIDCAPGGIRPGDLIAGVVKGTCLEKLPQAQPEATVGRLFGNWTWDFNGVVSDADWLEAQKVTKERLTALYTLGTIRYASW